MANITMCYGGKCPLKETCYKYRAKPNEYRQAYFMEPPYNFETQSCEYYWEIEE